MCGTGKYSVSDFKAHAVIDGTSYSFFKVNLQTQNDSVYMLLVCLIPKIDLKNVMLGV